MVQYGALDPVACADIQNTFASKGLLVKFDGSGVMITAAVRQYLKNLDQKELNKYFNINVSEQ